MAAETVILQCVNMRHKHQKSMVILTDWLELPAISFTKGSLSPELPSEVGYKLLGKYPDELRPYVKPVKAKKPEGIKRVSKAVAAAPAEK